MFYVSNYFSLISVVPQPVYMNMSDLERMRQHKLQQQQPQSPDEDGLDLKTPTQEDLDNLPSASSDGSSSGYGSQNMIPCDQGFNDGKLPHF